jgi:hypothetical protein
MSFYGNQVNWIPATYNPNNETINLLGKRVILNDQNNIVYGNYTTAMGYNTIAGSNAFKILSVNDKTMTLSSVEGLTAGMECSCQYDSCFDFFGTITNVDTVNNTVTFDNIPPADNFKTDDVNILWIPSNPELGDGKTTIGDGAFVAGEDNNACQNGSFIVGVNNIGSGKHSTIFGKNNKVGYSGFAAGNNHIVKGLFGVVFGNGNIIEDGESNFLSGSVNVAKKGVSGGFAHGILNELGATHSYTMGTGNITNKQNQIVFGKYNNPESDKVFIVGWGSSEHS